jgi:predicted metal-binding membrane protein
VTSAALSERVERSLVLFGLLAVSALAWAYLATMPEAAHPSGHHAGTGIAEPAAGPWGGAEWAVSLAMWTVMMAGMMVPTAVPVALTFARLNRARGCGPLVPVGAFVGGYLAVWTLYSASATVGQWGLHAARLLSPGELATGPGLGGLLLILAGLFQWSPWKDACMTRCRSPLGFLLAVWRPGRRGAFVMGLRYGAFCVGCCWALMVLSFAVGIMNLAWMTVLTAFMLAEKAAPAGRWISRAGGAGLAGWGTALLWRALA